VDIYFFARLQLPGQGAGRDKIASLCSAAWWQLGASNSIHECGRHDGLTSASCQKWPAHLFPAVLSKTIVKFEFCKRLDLYVDDGIPKEDDKANLERTV
jgi:hypothetical protein